MALPTDPRVTKAALDLARKNYVRAIAVHLLTQRNADELHTRADVQAALKLETADVERLVEIEAKRLGFRIDAPADAQQQGFAWEGPS